MAKTATASIHRRVVIRGSCMARSSATADWQVWILDHRLRFDAGPRTEWQVSTVDETFRPGLRPGHESQVVIQRSELATGVQAAGTEHVGVPHRVPQGATRG